jgi:adenylate cyclase class 2
MYEVEFKVRADHGPVRDRLEALGATHHGRVTQVDTYYDAPHRDFAATDEALRLREEDRVGATGEQSTRLTYKGPLVESASKTREELELAVPEGDTMDEILRGLGFDPAATVRKERDRYELEDAHAVLDDVEGLGQFVEVEATADAADVDAVRERAIAVLERLGLDPDEQIRTAYLGLLLDAE